MSTGGVRGPSPGPGWARRTASTDGRKARIPDGLPDRRRFRPTLCGTYVKPGIRPFAGSEQHTCGICADLAARHPPPRRIDPSIDLAVVSALLGSIGHRCDDPDLAPLFDYPHGGSAPMDISYVC